jgi:MoCo/4Fe-4S cofactor protein with predicted Tat translocation signal
MDRIEDTVPTQKYWQSLEQWRHDPEFAKIAENEFVSSPLKSSEGQDGWARREFLKLMGASLAMSTFGCVRRPAQKIIPYAKKPADVIHGIPNYYASSYVDGLEGIGILVTTRDGRPIKIEGNGDHPANLGGMSARAHAHILKLYDPDRYTGARRNLQNEKRSNHETIGVKWEDLDKAVGEQLAKGKVALLMNTSLSPSTQALVEEFSTGLGAKVYQHDDISYASHSDAQKTSYGQTAIPRYHIDQAKYIVAINNDFLGTWLTPIAFNRQFAKGRKADAGMNKLVVFEPLLTLTGSNADQRFRIRPSQSLDVVMALLNEIVSIRKQSRYASDDGVLRILSGFTKNQADLGFNVAEVADGLWKNRGQSLVLAGGLSAGTEDAESLQVAVNFLNSVLENDGKTIDASNGIVAAAKYGKPGIGELIAALKNKEVSTLIIHDCNPAYTLPAAAGFREALLNTQMVIYTGDRNDETARLADYVATDHHALENWGDLESFDGALIIQQPTIRPLYDTRGFQDSLLQWLKGSGKGSARAKASETWYDYLHSRWRDQVYAANKGKANGKSFDEFWVDLLQIGVLQTSAGSIVPRSFSSSALSGIKPAARKTGFELALYPTVGLGDGKLANVPWLQEFPDPVTKICWDNYASFSPKDAKQLKLHEGQYVKLAVGDASVEVPAHIQPGQADGVVGLAVGYGRTGAGKIADGVGVNAYTLAQWSNGRVITAGLETGVTALSRKERMACTQDHHSMEGRQIVVEETLQEHIKSPGGKVHRHKLSSMWSGHEYKGNKWGMVIDLNTCTGCGACVIACQSENNIPTVGKAYVIDGREMHWIRIDRYYTGTPEDPAVVNQPLPCMHCDNAPCESVCPVAATVHSDEGTNDMIYNRCVGTRYCSNNCPYKVRRFNWFNYTEVQQPRTLAMNPEVTQRFRGVMEKCTFCIHRIRFSKYRSKIEERPLKDGDIKTACQQSCPTNAIIFGDLNNPESTVAKRFDAPPSYALLEELNTRPAVHYQVKVRNTAEIKGESKRHGEHKEEGPHA